MNHNNNMIQVTDWNTIFDSNLEYILKYKMPPCVNLQMSSKGEEGKENFEAEAMDMDMMESEDSETEDIEIDVETVDETTRLKYPILALNPGVFEVYDRSTISLESEKESDYLGPFTEENGDDEDDWRQHGTIQVVDPLIIDPAMLRDLSNQLLEILADFKRMINKCNDHTKKQQLYYDLRTTMFGLTQTSATVTSLLQKCITVNEPIDRFEKSFRRDLYLVGCNADENDGGGDLFKKDKSDFAVAGGGGDSDSLKLESMHPLPYLNMCSTYFNPDSCDQYSLSLSLHSLGRYLLLFTHFRKIQTVSQYKTWTVCIEAYFVVLGKILSPFHKVISSQSPRIHDFMKNCLGEYFVSATMTWYTVDCKQIQEDIKNFSTIPLSTEEWTHLKSSYPPIFFKQEVENLRQLLIMNLRKL